MVVPFPAAEPCIQLPGGTGKNWLDQFTPLVEVETIEPEPTATNLPPQKFSESAPYREVCAVQSTPFVEVETMFQSAPTKTPLPKAICRIQIGKPVSSRRICVCQFVPPLVETTTVPPSPRATKRPLPKAM